MRSYLPELLPRFTALVAEAERSGNYSPVRPALKALEALGNALEEHLQLMLPLLNRLISPGDPASGMQPGSRLALLCCAGCMMACLLH